MLIFDHKQLLSPDELSRLADIDPALIRRAINGGCPSDDGRISFDVYSGWINVNFQKILPEFEVSSFPAEGLFSEEDQYWILRPVLEWQLESTPVWLDVGGPGCDGISWVIRENSPGVWAYYPIDDEFVLMAADAAELARNWKSGKISV